MGWIGKNATIDGRRYVYLEAGDSRASDVLVLVHAFPVGMRMWESSTVPKGWRALAPALPGFDGAAAIPHESTNIDDYALAVLALMDHARVDRAVIGGLSMGGYVTFALWRLAAERIRGLVLANTRATADTEQGREGRGKMLQLVARGGSRAVADEMLVKLLGETTRQSQPQLVDRVWRLIERQTTEGLSDAIRRLRDRPDSTRLLDDITVPVLIVVGEEDVVTPPADSVEMHERLALARLTSIPRAGHLSSMENPSAFDAALESFLNGFRS